MEYVDLSIHISPGSDGQYTVAAKSPEAGNADSTLQLPFALEDLAGKVHGVAETISAMHPRADEERGTQFLLAEEATPSGNGHDPATVGDFGAELYEALFSSDIKSLLDRTQGSISRSRDKGVRIRLSMDLGGEGMAELASLPWELIAPGPTDTALVLSAHTVLVRSVSTPHPTMLVPFAPPLRILVVRSNPTGTGALDLDKEQKRIEETWALQSGVRVDFVDPVYDRILDYLADKDPHVIHYMGHGDFDAATGGSLVLETEDGKPDPIDSDRLKILFQDEKHTLRLVFLNACNTATTARSPVLDPFAGVAASLMKAGVPAVVAMQFPISDHAAIKFSDTFYRRIAAGDPVDKAVTEARKRLHSEWATPVLFLQSEDGHLFEAAPPPAPADPRPEGSGAETPPEVTPRDSADDFHVLLCSVADELRPYIRQFDTELTAAGIRVTKDIPPPHDDAEHAEAVREAVRTADLCVHLLGSHPGEPFESEASRPYPFTYPIEQLKIGLESARAQLLLMPEHLDLQAIEDQDYLSFVRSLARLSRDPKQFEMVRTGRHQMVDAILAKYQDLQKAAPRVDAGGVDLAWLDTHTKDLGSAQVLVDQLSARKIKAMINPVHEDAEAASALEDTASALRVFEDNLEKAPMLIVVFGNVEHRWVEHRLIQAVKVVTSNRFPTRIGVYVAPPQKTADELNFPPFYDVVSGIDGFDSEALDAMIQRVVRSGS